MKNIILTLSLALLLTASACGGALATEMAAPEAAPVENVIPVPESTATEIVVAPPQGKIPAASFESQPYINETFGFIMDYPVGWVSQETVIGERGTQVLLVSSPELVEAASMPEGGSRVNITIYDWDPKKDLTAYAEYWKGVWESSGFTILEEQARTLDLGLAAIQFKVQTSDATIPYLITAIGEKYLVLSGEGDMALVNEILPRLRPINQ